MCEHDGPCSAQYSSPAHPRGPWSPPFRFVDPNDPSTVYLAQQPVDESQRLASAPRYAANYGQDEVYEPMGLRP